MPSASDRPLRPLAFEGGPGVARLHPDTDPDALPAGLSRAREVRLQESVPSELLRALAASLAQFPDVELTVIQQPYATEAPLDPELKFLRGFEHIHRLAIVFYLARTFEVLEGFTELMELNIDRTKSSRPSLAVLRRMRKLKVLTLTGHGRDFDSGAAGLDSLQQLSIGGGFTSLSALAGHPQLRSVDVRLNTLRDLSPLVSCPEMQIISLDQVKGFTTDDLRPLATVKRLSVVSLEGLSHVRSLETLGKDPTINWLRLSSNRDLETLQPLAAWTHLRVLTLAKSRPGDELLEPLLQIPTLQAVTIGPETYPADQIEMLRRGFRGRVLWYHGEFLAGNQHELRSLLRDISGLEYLPPRLAVGGGSDAAVTG
jgi:hypothetical protein